MAAPEHILAKLKLLMNLAASPNENEAGNAKLLAKKLIDKYSITDQELKDLEDKEPLYGENNKVYHTVGMVGWRQQVILAVGKYYYCHIIQEELVPAHGINEFNYYVYGEPEDEISVKFVFNALAKKVEDLIMVNCIGRGPVYKSSYGEGIAAAIKENIYWDGIELPDVKAKKVKPKTEEKKSDEGGNIVQVKETKEKPEEKSVDVNQGSTIKDIQAYFRGLDDGRDVSLKEVLILDTEALELLLSEGSEENAEA